MPSPYPLEYNEMGDMTVPVDQMYAASINRERPYNSSNSDLLNALGHVFGGAIMGRGGVGQPFKQPAWRPYRGANKPGSARSGEIAEAFDSMAQQPRRMEIDDWGAVGRAYRNISGKNPPRQPGPDELMQNAERYNTGEQWGVYPELPQEMLFSGQNPPLAGRIHGSGLAELREMLQYFLGKMSRQ